MEMTGEQRIAAPRQKVWEALNDPAVLKQCIPGCQSLEVTGENQFAAVAEVKIGPIGARFKGNVELSDLDPPNGYKITGSGSGGVAGSAKGGATIRLSDDGEGTLVAYNVDAEVGGRMAQLGGPIIDATAKNLAGKFFAKFGQVVAGQSAAAAPVAEPGTTAAATAPAAAPVAPATATAPAAFATTGTASSPWGLVFAVGLAILAGFLLGRSTAADWWVIAVMILIAITTAVGYEAGKRSGAGA